MPSFPRFHSPGETNPHHHSLPTDFLRVLEELDRSASSPRSTSASNSHRRAFSPTFDVHETEREYILEGEFPGLSDKKNISIGFTDDKTILISGKIEREFQGGLAEEQKKVGGDQTSAGQEDIKKEKVKERKYWVSERLVGEFSRCFSFPGLVDIDGVRASLEFGILKVVVPKMEKKIGCRIEIH